MTPDPQLDDMLHAFAAVLGKTPDQLRYEFERYRSKQARRVARHNAAFYDALERITKTQAAAIQALRSLGATPWPKLRQHRDSGNVVIFLSRESVWNDVKGRMGRKIYAVYPDGTRSETFERSISVRKEF